MLQQKKSAFAVLEDKEPKGAKKSNESPEKDQEILLLSAKSVNMKVEANKKSGR